MKCRFHPIVILLVLFAVFASTPAWAQVQTGSIFVQATDEQGAAVPGASITLTSPVLPQPLTGVTDSTGAYRFQSLTLGTYTVRVEESTTAMEKAPEASVAPEASTEPEFASTTSTSTKRAGSSGSTPVNPFRSYSRSR